MAEKNGLLIHFWNPQQFFILQQDNQQDEDAPYLIQRISRLDAVISKLLNIDIESLEATNIECSLLTLEKMVQPSECNRRNSARSNGRDGGAAVLNSGCA